MARLVNDESEEYRSLNLVTDCSRIARCRRWSLILCASLALLQVSCIKLADVDGNYLNLSIPGPKGGWDWRPIEHVTLSNDGKTTVSWILRKTGYAHKSEGYDTWASVFDPIDLWLTEHGWEQFEPTVKPSYYFPESDFLAGGEGGYVVYKRRGVSSDLKDRPLMVCVAIWPIPTGYKVRVATAKPSLGAKLFRNF